MGSSNAIKIRNLMAACLFVSKLLIGQSVGHQIAQAE